MNTSKSIDTEEGSPFSKVPSDSTHLPFTPEIFQEALLIVCFLVTVGVALLVYLVSHWIPGEQLKLLLGLASLPFVTGIILLINRVPLILIHFAIIGVILDRWEGLDFTAIPFFTLSKGLFLIATGILLVRYLISSHPQAPFLFPAPALAHLPFSLICLGSTLAFSYSLKSSLRWVIAPLTLPFFAIVLTQFISGQRQAMASLKALALYSFFPIGLALVETFTQHRLTGAMNFVLYGIDDIFRVAGSFENPNDFVVLLLFSVPLLLLWSLQTKRWSLRLFLIAGCLLELLILMKTYSRSGYLSMAFTLLMIAVLGQGKIRRLGILLCFLGVCGLLGLQETRDRLVTLVGIRTSGPGVSQGLASVNYRRQLASIALNEFSKKPVLGVGFGNIGARAATYSPLLANKSTAENTYLEILAELGLVGFLAYLFFLGIAWSTLKTGLNRVRGDPNIEPFYVALAAGFCGFAFNNLFDTNFQDNLPWILLAILVHLGVSQACPIPLNETKGNDHPPDVRIPCQTLP